MQSCSRYDASTGLDFFLSKNVKKNCKNVKKQKSPHSNIIKRNKLNLLLTSTNVLTSKSTELWAFFSPSYKDEFILLLSVTAATSEALTGKDSVQRNASSSI